MELRREGRDGARPAPRSVSTPSAFAEISTDRIPAVLAVVPVSTNVPRAKPESRRIAHPVCDAGFTSAETAARAFKMRFGVTPRDFRGFAPAARSGRLADWWEAFR